MYQVCSSSGYIHYDIAFANNTLYRMDEMQTAAKQAPFPADEKQPLVTDTTKAAL